MHPSTIIQFPDSDLYSINCLEEIELGDLKMSVRFTTKCRFQTAGQKIFLGMLNPESPWLGDGHHGFGVTIDTEDGTIEDMINNLGVIDYADCAPFSPDQDLHLSVQIEKQNRVLIAEITINGESILHPAIYLEDTTKLGAFVGTTLLWGGSARFDVSSVERTHGGTSALAS